MEKSSSATLQLFFAPLLLFNLVFYNSKHRAVVWLNCFFPYAKSPRECLEVFFKNAHRQSRNSVKIQDETGTGWNNHYFFSLWFFVLERLFPALEHLISVFCFFRKMISSRDVSGRPGTFAPALVSGLRDTGARRFFCPETFQTCFLQFKTLCSSVAELRFSICKVAAGMSCGFFQKHTPTKQKFYPEKTHLYNALIISWHTKICVYINCHNQSAFNKVLHWALRIKET